MIAAIYARVEALVFALALGVPYVAAAACAWVLWFPSSEYEPGNPSEMVWRIGSAFGSQDECTQSRDCTLVRWRNEVQTEHTVRLGDVTLHHSGELIGPDGRITRTRDASEKVTRVFNERVVCLPDTVDPRGPKGGGR